MEHYPTTHDSGRIMPKSHWFTVLIASYRRGLPQIAMATLSAIVLAFQLLRQQYHAPGRPWLHKPVGTVVFEPMGQFLNVTTLCLFIAARGTPWLQAGTIQGNFLFYNAYDEKRYRKVVGACCFNVDLEEMEHGDQTVIGSGAVALSGGQQARVALARALYSSASLLLLDDIFSALDTRTSLEHWNGVFCSDLLQKKTVILVTQNTWIADEANVVIVMDNGRVQSVSRREGHVRKAKPIQKTDVSGKLPAEPRTYVPANENAHNEDSEAAVADQARPVTESVSSLLGK
ncbi:ABC transporter [Beauveria brongniartii RCEF 3172]|uniref:ABC transporter n=1 Tax=Beauveria brongniartii RCEF 3172 TaxID=1081107 RepID=A0A167BWK4_9HYPO|nr:ABC transporter [Beauveria brongniartii RCEF 3172]